MKIATLIKVKNSKNSLGMGLQPIILKFLNILLIYYYINIISTASIVVRGAIGFTPIIALINCIQKLLIRVKRTFKVFITIF